MSIFNSGNGILVAALPVINFTATVANVFQVVFGIIGVLSVMFVAFGGFKYVISAGNPAGIRQAKDTILYALIGLAVGISANVIIAFTLGRFG